MREEKEARNEDERNGDCIFLDYANPYYFLILSYYPSIGRIEKWAIASVIALAYVFIFRKTLKMKLF